MRRLVKWNRGRETIVYKFDRWNFSFHPFLFSLYFFPPAWNYGSFDKWAPYDPIKTREKWRKRTFHLIFGNVVKGNKNLAVHSIISNSVPLLFSVFFPLLTRSRTISRSLPVSPSGNFQTFSVAWKVMRGKRVLIKKETRQSSIVLYLHIFHSLSLFEFLLFRYIRRLYRIGFSFDLRLFD